MRTSRSVPVILLCVLSSAFQHRLPQNVPEARAAQAGWKSYALSIVRPLSPAGYRTHLSLVLDHVFRTHSAGFHQDRQSLTVTKTRPHRFDIVRTRPGVATITSSLPYSLVARFGLLYLTHRAGFDADLFPLNVRDERIRRGIGIN